MASPTDSLLEMLNRRRAAFNPQGTTPTQPASVAAVVPPVVAVPPPPAPAPTQVAPAPTPAAPIYSVNGNRKVLTASGSEMDRILRLPIVDYYDTKKYPDLTKELTRPGRPATWRDPMSGRMVTGFNPTQNAALHAVRETGGGLICGGAGVGKTLIGQACTSPQLVGCDSSIYCGPATTIPQLMERHATWTIQYAFGHPSYLSFDRLSSANGEATIHRAIERSKHPIVVCDEVHRLGNYQSARAGRMDRLFEQYPNLRMVAMTGSILNTSLHQIAHIATWALGANSPIPRHGTVELERWANVIDFKAEPKALDYVEIDPLVVWHTGTPILNYPEDERQAVARAAFLYRLQSCPGVVCTTESTLDTPLRIRKAVGSDDLVMPDDIRVAIDQLRSTSEINIDGNYEVFPDKLAQSRAEAQLSAGYFYRWDWPISKETKRPLRDEDWMLARSNWFKFVRDEIKYARAERYDTEKHVRTAIARQCADPAFTGRHAGHLAWLAWEQQSKKRWDGKPQPPTKVVWLSSYYVDYIMAWVEKHATGRGKPPVTIWYASQAMEQALAERGVEILTSRDPAQLMKPRVLAVSITKFGEGIEFQRWSRGLVVEPPPSGTRWEQMLARMHRQGQTADEVIYDVPIHCERWRRNMRAAQQNATFIQETTGNQQRLVFADKLQLPLSGYRGKDQLEFDQYESNYDNEDEDEDFSD